MTDWFPDVGHLVMTKAPMWANKHVLYIYIYITQKYKIKKNLKKECEDYIIVQYLLLIPCIIIKDIPPL
jgi:hypothetical protein